jgi:hypothetical protein
MIYRLPRWTYIHEREGQSAGSRTDVSDMVGLVTSSDVTAFWWSSHRPVTPAGRNPRPHEIAVAVVAIVRVAHIRVAAAPATSLAEIYILWGATVPAMSFSLTSQGNIRLVSFSRERKVWSSFSPSPSKFQLKLDFNGWYTSTYWRGCSWVCSCCVIHVDHTARTTV